MSRSPRFATFMAMNSLFNIASLIDKSQVSLEACDLSGFVTKERQHVIVFDLERK